MSGSSNADIPFSPGMRYESQMSKLPSAFAYTTSLRPRPSPRIQRCSSKLNWAFSGCDPSGAMSVGGSSNSQWIEGTAPLPRLGIAG